MLSGFSSAVTDGTAIATAATAAQKSLVTVAVFDIAVVDMDGVLLLPRLKPKHD